MTVLEEIHNRHRNFHRAIARKAKAIELKPAAVERIEQPELPAVHHVSYYYRQMWFWDLVQEIRPAAPTPLVTVKSIMAATQRFYGITRVDMTCNRRTKELVIPRQVAMYLCKTLTLKSLPEIGRWFNRDHTTVLHGIRKIERLREIDPLLSADVAEITKGTV